MEQINKIELEQLANKYFSSLKIRIDIDVLYPQISKYKVSHDQLVIIFQSIIKNFNFFVKELNYPLQLSNLFFYEIDARNEPQENCRGTEYRHDLVKKYSKLVIRY